MMRRLVGWFILVPLALVLVLFALANRHAVLVRFDPVSLANPVVPAFEAPLFLVIYGMLLIGILLGGTAVWFAQGRHRREKSALRRDRDRLGRELETARRAPPTGGKGVAATDDLADLE